MKRIIIFQRCTKQTLGCCSFSLLLNACPCRKSSISSIFNAARTYIIAHIYLNRIAFVSLHWRKIVFIFVGVCLLRRNSSSSSEKIATFFFHIIESKLYNSTSVLYLVSSVSLHSMIFVNFNVPHFGLQKSSHIMGIFLAPLRICQVKFAYASSGKVSSAKFSQIRLLNFWCFKNHLRFNVLNFNKVDYDFF